MYGPHASSRLTLLRVAGPHDQGVTEGGADVAKQQALLDQSDSTADADGNRNPAGSGSWGGMPDGEGSEREAKVVEVAGQEPALAAA